MAVLKKIKGTTLMETLVATVLLVVVFAVASLVMQNQVQILAGSKTSAVEAELIRVEYLMLHKQLASPYSGQWQDWTLEGTQKPGLLQLEAVQQVTGKRIKRTLILPK